MSTAVLQNEAPERIAEILDPPPPPKPPADLESYRKLIDRYLAGESIPVDEVRAVLARAYRDSLAFAADVRTSKDRRERLAELATCGIPAAERQAAKEKALAAAKAACQREKPKHEAAIRAAQAAINTLEGAIVLGERILADEKAAHAERVAHCRQRLFDTAPAALRNKLSALRRENAALQQRSIEVQTGEWELKEAEARRDLKAAEDLRDQLQESLKESPANSPFIDGDGPRLKELKSLTTPVYGQTKSKITMLREALEHVLAHKPNGAILAARQKEITREHNDLVDSIFSADVRPDLAE
ncbi:MAG TPA: hypothetical protein VMP01_08960 [Pirellulaceae bacterium]|nr:hypothetical protein [Pirellulaceae bacterium]